MLGLKIGNFSNKANFQGNSSLKAKNSASIRFGKNEDWMVKLSHQDKEVSFDLFTQVLSKAGYLKEKNEDVLVDLMEKTLFPHRPIKEESIKTLKEMGLLQPDGKLDESIKSICKELFVAKITGEKDLWNCLTISKILHPLNMYPINNKK